MQNIDKTSKFLMVIVALGLIVWLGGAVMRTVIAYDIYVPASELVLKPYYSDEIRMHTVRLYAMGSAYTGVSFSLVFVSALILLLRFRKEVRQRGWLFMAFVLFFIACPIELYNIYLDIKLSFAVLWNTNIHFDSWEVGKFFASRLKTMNQVSPMAYLAVLTAIAIVVWRPLDKRTISEPKTETAETES